MRKTVIAAAGVFLAAVLLVNAGLFTTPIFEHTDFALNSLQVREAKAFHELLGNYSRWTFHHPGPAVFYLMAFGEWLFYDATHLVPAPMNAQLLTLILFNTVLLFGAVRLFAERFPAPAFPPLALGAAALVTATINHAVPGSAPVSAWMPHVALFPFLFFLAVCVPVAAGEMRRMPLLAAAGMLLIHLHVAQCLFAGVLGGAACLSGFRRRGAAPWRRPVLAAAAVVGLFLAPILLEIALHEPDNLDAVLTYLRQHPGAQQSFGVSLWYFGTFLAFLPSPEAARPGFESLWTSCAQPRVALYWLAFACAAALAVWAGRKGGKRVPAFLRFALLACAAAAALFLFWGTRIAGELYNFNGYFIYSLQFLLWFVLAAMAPAALPRRALPAVWAAALALLAVSSPRFKATYAGEPALPAIAAGVPRMGPGELRLDFRHDEWEQAAGIGLQLARQGKPFCVVPAWEFAFGRPYVCRESTAQTRLVFAPGPAVTLRPPVWLRLPFEIAPAGGADVKEGFYPPEPGYRWTFTTGSIRFPLARDFAGRGPVRIRVEASTYPGRPARLLLNGRPVGTIDHLWKSAAEFTVGREWFRPGEENRVAFEVPNAGPVGTDYRQLGLRFERLRVEAVE